MDRRDVLKALALAGPLTITGRLYAAPSTSTRLLVVFLRGAYDAANVVIPVSSDFYYQSRPNLAIARPNPSDPNAALPLNSDWGLHPVLKDTLYPLYHKGELAFVPFAGTDDASRSHFETQDSIELGQALTGTRDFRSGFMSRLAGQLTDAKPIAFTDQLPLTFRGGASIPNMGLNAVSKPAVDDRQAALIKSMYRNTNLEPSVAQGFAVRDQVYETVATEMQEANRNAVSPRGFELAARRIAGLMNGRFNLGFVDVGGWDTHVNQGGASGYLANRLAELGRGLAGVCKGQRHGVERYGGCRDQRVRPHLPGERRPRHRSRPRQRLLGDGRRRQRWTPGRRQVKVEQATLFQNRDYPVINEYRALLGGLFARVYGLPADRLQKVFPGAAPKDLGLV